MSDRCEWVEIVEPRSQEHMYANLTTGECSWSPPPGVKIKKTSDQNQWWELFDANTSRFYYYNSNSQQTVWHKPQNCDIIPLAKLQTLKLNTEAVEDGRSDPSPRTVIQREISTQTPPTSTSAPPPAVSSSFSNMPQKKDVQRTGSLQAADISPLNQARKHGSRTQKFDRQRSEGGTRVSGGTLQAVDERSSQRSETRSKRDGQPIKFSHEESQWRDGGRLDTGRLDAGRHDAGRLEAVQKNDSPRDSPSMRNGAREPRKHGKTGNSAEQDVSRTKRGGANQNSPLINSHNSIQKVDSPRSMESPRAPEPFHYSATTAPRSSGGSRIPAWDQSLNKARGLGDAGSVNYFQRQDSLPLTRGGDGGFGFVRDHADVMGSIPYAVDPQLQDVSLITTVQVTPRPKPRQFPRTNPSFVGTKRRTGGPQPTMGLGGQTVFNQGFTGGMLGEGRGGGYVGGSRTMQAPLSYEGEGGRRGKLEQQRSGERVLDDSSSSCSSSDEGEMEGFGGSHDSGMGKTARSQRYDQKQRYTLDSRIAKKSGGSTRGGAARMNESIVRPIPIHPEVFQQSRFDGKGAGPPSAPVVLPERGLELQPHDRRKGLPDDLRSSSSSHQPNHPARPHDFTHQPPMASPREKVVGATSNGVAEVRNLTRHNSEPDYVNVPSKGAENSTEGTRDVGNGWRYDSGIHTLGVRRKKAPHAEPPRRKGREEEEMGYQNGGTLRLRDQGGVEGDEGRFGGRSRFGDPGDYANTQDLFMSSSIYCNTMPLADGLYPGMLDNSLDTTSDRSSVFSTPSPQTQSRNIHSVPPSTNAPETHHPSLRRRGAKWPPEKSAPPVSSSSSVRQSTLEKSLSLQAELAAQNRPLSMLVPYGLVDDPLSTDTGNAIVNQVADSLLQQMDMERFINENLNEHRKGILGKTVPIGNMLIWTKDIIQKPMIRTENKNVKKEAPEVFRLIQTYMGDRKGKDCPGVVAMEVLMKGWSMPELRDEIYIQLCRQTTRNPRDDSMLNGWELLGICLSFFAPSSRLQSYMEAYMTRTLDSRDHTEQGQLHRYASSCFRRLQRICLHGAKRKPSVEEIDLSRKSLLEPSMFGSTLEDVMDLQREIYPDRKLPWIQTVLSEELLKLAESQQLTEGVFRVPGDTDEVNTLKSSCDQWLPPSSYTDAHIPASLLKLWYRELHDPLIPRQFYTECVDSYNNPEAAVEVVTRLPELNKLVLTYLIRFLQKFSSAENTAVTKMDSNNLAMVMAPNCLRCESEDPQVLFENARKEMVFIRLLIQHLDTTDVEGVV